jgi:alginate O-acetyltransferase complex protein AlgI
MLFSSSIFLFLFLPIVLGFYYLSPDKFKNFVLLIFSLFFYTWGEKALVLVMVLSTVIDFFAGQIIAKGNKKFGLLLSVFADLGLLGFFKYFNFAFENFHALINFFGVDNPFLHNVPHITLPIGISFYTFQTMSYTIDVYRGHVKANENFIDFAAYVVMFPQLIAGPIVRYADVYVQLKNKNINAENFALGVKRFIIGLSKKMLIANACATVADGVFEAPVNEISTVWAWVGIIAYAFQIFFDFSGYSDMAIGLGKMFGFDFLENFNYPYISKNIREFWQRWHISLSTWFRDYLYIPLGGNRVRPKMVYRNLLIVFFITGLWHGASWNFIVWGMFHGFFLILERTAFGKILNRVWLPVRHAYTLLVVLIGWVFFRANSLLGSFEYITRMFSLESGEPARVSYLNFFYVNSEYLVISIVAIFWSTPALEKFAASLMEPGRRMPIFKWLEITFLFLLFILAASYVAADTYNPFIYFRF